jgi:hypothetical protein
MRCNRVVSALKLTYRQKFLGYYRKAFFSIGHVSWRPHRRCDNGSAPGCRGHEKHTGAHCTARNGHSVNWSLAHPWSPLQSAGLRQFDGVCLMICPQIVYTDVNGLFCKVALQPQTPGHGWYASWQGARSLHVNQNGVTWVE